MARVSARLLAALSNQRLQDYAFITLIALGSRALYLGIGALALVGMSPDGWLPRGGLLSIMEHWDAGYYWAIATGAYEAPLPPEYAGGTLYAFFPVYPLLIRAAMVIARSGPVAAGVLVSTLLFVLALFLIYEYARELGLSREVGIATLVLLSFAPESFVFSAIYTESTFLFLLAAAMLALRRRRYLLAGIAAALLSGARPNGIVFVVFALAWTLRAVGWRALARPWNEPGPMLTIVLAPLGLVTYWWYCYIMTGDAFAQATAVTHIWGWALDWPWVNIGNHLRGSPVERFSVLGSLLYFVASLLLIRFRMYEEFVFCLACFMLYWVNVLPYSLVRYALVLFPIFVGLARVTARRPLLLASVTGVSAALNGLLMVAFALDWPIAI